MANREQTTDNVTDLLTVGHFGKPEEISESGEPVMETMMSLTLDELVEYDRNPRRAPSAEYDTLRASYIKTGAAQTLLVVTRRPGEKRWFPAAGGNTRIRVLKELWERFQDERYWRVNCKVVPFPGDTRVLVDHLAENDNRAEYIFIDRARTVCELHERLETEEGASLSQRAFIEKIRDMGYPKLSRAQLDRFQYAYRLYDLIPLAMDGGMHDRAIRKMRELQDSLKDFLDKAIGIGFDPDRFGDHWGLVLQELDNSEGIDLELLVNGVLSALAPMAAERVPDLTDEQVSMRLIRLWKSWSARVDRGGCSVSLEREEVFSGARVTLPQHGTGRGLSEEEVGNLGLEQGSDVGTDAASGQNDTSDTSAPHDAGINPQDGSSHTRPDASGLSLSDRTEEKGGSPAGVPERKGENDVAGASTEELYRRLLYLADHTASVAQHFASRWGLGDLVFPIRLQDGSPTGVGYLIDLPVPNPRLQGQQATAWRLLWDVSGITDRPDTVEKLIGAGVLDDSRQITRTWTDILEGRSSVPKSKIDTLHPDRRKAALGQIFRNVVDAWVPRNLSYLRFLQDVDQAGGESFLQLLMAYRDSFETMKILRPEAGQ